MSAAVVLPFVWATTDASQVYEQSKFRCVQRVDPEPLAEGLQARSAGRRVARVAAPELAFYRKYTEGMLRRYVKLSLESGRTPSLLGQEMFRGKVTSYRVRSFEDVVIFVHDMEKCVGKLESAQQKLIKRIGMQEYTQAEAASMLGLTLRTAIRRYGEALDRLTQILLEVGMLEPLVECGDCQGPGGGR